MRSLLLGFAAGVCCLQMQAQLPGRWLLLSLLALLPILFFIVRWASRPALKIPALLACGAIAGFSSAALCSQHYLADQLPQEVEGADIVLVGTIHSLPFRLPQGERFNFAVESAQVDGKPKRSVPPKGALSWYRASRAEDLRVPEVQPGDAGN